MPEGCLGLVSTAPFPIQFSPGHGLVCGPVNTPTRVQHSLQGRCLARAGLDNMWYIFTPLLQNEELERAPEHCDSSTMRLFPLAWKHSFHCGLQHCSGWSVLPCDFSHTPFLCLIKKKRNYNNKKSITMQRYRVFCETTLLAGALWCPHLAEVLLILM